MSTTVQMTVEIVGKTYAAREIIKDFGGVWNGRAWTMRQDQWDAMKAKVTPTYSRAQARLLSNLVARPLDKERAFDAMYNDGAEGYNPAR
jgi:hypothetical protein